MCFSPPMKVKWYCIIYSLSIILSPNPISGPRRHSRSQASLPWDHIMDWCVWVSRILEGNFVVFPWNTKDWGKKKPASSCLEARTGTIMFTPILPRDITYLDLFIFYCCFLYCLKIKVWWSNQVSDFYTHTQGFSLNHVPLLKLLSSSLFCSSCGDAFLSILTYLWNKVGIKRINKYLFILVTYFLNNIRNYKYYFLGGEYNVWKSLSGDTLV